MDKKKLQDIKEAKKKIVEGSLTIWNARLDALAERGNIRDLINYIGGPVVDDSWTNICGCPEPDSPVCFCSCPPDNSEDLYYHINEMGRKINLILENIDDLRNNFKK
ncbi:hypothetical protein [Halanaerobium hydrogeniformans]|uniref:Uncharacterized protein n=1 Tax=Halanaerobium hydrogeniformans TaxID=656519 RepID=E4RMC6_HALHG|nr:hypothetical protein [Halanaerobium hydrogeniformans]ADQ14457.1 hypothetical protein Halsa_1014 [Halanaerobium hydrogeniformans]